MVEVWLSKTMESETSDKGGDFYIEKGFSPWLFFWHDHGWMSASVTRGLENIKGVENQHLS